MNIAAYPKYESYKPTGVEWAPEAPDHWDVKPIAAAARVISEANRPDLELLSVYLGQGVIRFSDVDAKRTNATSLDLSKYQVVRPGNLVLNNQQAWRGSVGVSEHTGIVSPAYIVLDLKDSFDRRFADYYFQTTTTVSHFLVSSKGVGTIQRNLYWPALRRCPVTIPPLPEQRAIAAFLDGKCATIDEAVRIKEEQIRLLAERRQILIQQAVTRGLNKDAPMKDSGIDWIGQIPAHWDILRNFALFRETKNAGNAGLPVLSVSIHSGVSREELSEEENIRSIIKIEDRSSYKEVLPGDIAYNMMRAWQGGIGAVYTHGMVSPAYVVARPIADLVADYFELLYRTPAFIRQMDASSKGITDFRKRLYWDDFRDCLTIVPPKAEQEEIIRYSSDISAKIQNAISLKESQITALREYKTSLINAAVTGKIKVQGF